MGGDVKLSTELVNAILQYLGNRPYVEVAGIISAIQQEAAKKEDAQDVIKEAD